MVHGISTVQIGTTDLRSAVFDPVDMVVGQIQRDSFTSIDPSDVVHGISTVQIGTTDLRSADFGPVDVFRTLGKRGRHQDNREETD